MRVIGRCLVKICILILRQGAIHLIRGYMQELLPLFKAAVRKLPCRSGTVQHHSRTQYIGLHKDLRVTDASVHMALRRKMHHPVNLIFLKNAGNRFLVADVRLYKGIIGPVLDIFQILQISRIGQQIHIDDTYLIAVFTKHVMNIIGTDKAGASCHEISSHFFTPSHSICSYQTYPFLSIAEKQSSILSFAYAFRNTDTRNNQLHPLYGLFQIMSIVKWTISPVPYPPRYCCRLRRSPVRNGSCGLKQLRQSFCRSRSFLPVPSAADSSLEAVENNCRVTIP